MSVFLGLVCAGIAIFIFVSLIINSFRSKKSNINRKIYHSNKTLINKDTTKQINNLSSSNIVDFNKPTDSNEKTKLKLQDPLDNSTAKKEVNSDNLDFSDEKVDIKLESDTSDSNLAKEALDEEEVKVEEEIVTKNLHHIESSDRKVEFGDNLFTLFILAKTDQNFEGYTLYQILIDEGLIFGDMDIFHYFSESEPSDSRHIFSIAQATESGTFDLDSFGSKSYSGICVVMNIDSSSKCRDDFDLMLEKSYNIAKSLNGLVYDQDKKLLRNTELENYYNEIFGEKLVN